MVHAMRFVGVDLAWGHRGGTGVCAADADGDVLASERCRTDDEIVAAIEPHASGPVLVGFDAPIVVTNADGRRPCDALVSRVFGPEEAGVYPANTSRPDFATGTRAQRLARRLGLALDPWIEPGSRSRTALETYPHAALVALFGLSRILKYKYKRGRSRPGRQAEFGRFCDLLETLVDHAPSFDVTTSPRWSQLRRASTGAETHAALDRAEDELDAYVCAYTVLHYWHHGHGDACRVIGDEATGHILTPVTPMHLARLEAIS